MLSPLPSHLPQHHRGSHGSIEGLAALGHGDLHRLLAQFQRLLGYPPAFAADDHRRPGEIHRAQVFRILSAVAQTRGCVHLPDGGEEQTVYSLCFDLERGRCMYTTQENSRPTGVELLRADLEGDCLRSVPLRRRMDICWEN